jgi:excisionase family DNA binding protein
MEPEPLLTSDEVAAYLKIDVVTVRRLVARGDLAAYRIGNEYRFARGDLAEYLRRQHVPARGSAAAEALFGEEIAQLLRSDSNDAPRSGLTRGARQALQYAAEEARQAGRTTIGTEYVLLGLCRETTGLAARVLENLGIAPEAIRAAAAGGEDWPEPLADAPSASDAPKLSEHAHRVLQGAVAQAGEWRHHYVGTEHVLWGLTQVADGNSVLVLELLGIAPDMVQAELLRHVKPA